MSHTVTADMCVGRCSLPAFLAAIPPFAAAVFETVLTAPATGNVQADLANADAAGEAAAFKALGVGHRKIL